MRGRTNNPHGRPKGSPNKRNAEMREKIMVLIDSNWDKVQFDLDGLEPKDRLSFLEKLMSYTLPKLQSVQVESDQNLGSETITIFKIPDNGRSFDVKSMSSEELRAILDRGDKQLEGGRG